MFNINTILLYKLVLISATLQSMSAINDEMSEHSEQLVNLGLNII